MIALMLLLTFGEYGSSKDPIVDVVSVIELNHDYDSNGYILNDQLIFWNWKPADNKYEVVDFIILKGGRENLTTEEHKRREKEHQDKWLAEGNPAPPPPYNHPWVGHGAVPYKYGANWVSYFKDDDVYRKVIATSYIQTWTQGDPEIADRIHKPVSQRKRLKYKKITPQDEAAMFLEGFR